MATADAVEYVVGGLIGLLGSAVLWEPAFQIVVCRSKAHCILSGY